RVSGDKGYSSRRNRRCLRRRRIKHTIPEPRVHRVNTTVVGTWQAAADVAGLAAYLLSTSKDLTPATVGKAITTPAVPDRLLDLPEGTRTCWRSTTRRPADHLPT